MLDISFRLFISFYTCLNASTIRILAADNPGSKPPKKPMERETIKPNSITDGVILILKATSKRSREYPFTPILKKLPMIPPNVAMIRDSIIKEVRICDDLYPSALNVPNSRVLAAMVIYMIFIPPKIAPKDIRKAMISPITNTKVEVSAKEA